MPLRAFPCWWTREAKVTPLSKLQDDADEIFIGIADDESKRMSSVPGHKYRYPLVEWGWTEQDCVDYLNKLGMLRGP